MQETLFEFAPCSRYHIRSQKHNMKNWVDAINKMTKLDQWGLCMWLPLNLLRLDKHLIHSVRLVWVCGIQASTRRVKQDNMLSSHAPAHSCFILVLLDWEEGKIQLVERQKTPLIPWHVSGDGNQGQPQPKSDSHGTHTCSGSDSAATRDAHTPFTVWLESQLCFWSSFLLKQNTHFWEDKKW